MKPVQAVQQHSCNELNDSDIRIFNTAVAGCAAVARAETDVPKPFFSRRLSRLYGLSTHRKALVARTHGIPTHTLRVVQSTLYSVSVCWAGATGPAPVESLTRVARRLDPPP